MYVREVASKPTLRFLAYRRESETEKNFSSLFCDKCCLPSFVLVLCASWHRENAGGGGGEFSQRLLLLRDDGGGGGGKSRKRRKKVKRGGNKSRVNEEET